MDKYRGLEVKTQPEDCNRLVVGSFESLPLWLQKKWLDARRDGMSQHEDWDVEDDYDHYDADPKTVHIILLNDENEIIAGMRLTPEASVKETLSLSMLLRPEDVPADALQGIEGPVWDITRLIPGPGSEGKTAREKMAAFTELFAAAFAITSKMEDNPLWVFVSYYLEDKSKFIASCAAYGMVFTPVEGTQQGDVQLFYTYPREMIDFLKDNRTQYFDAWRSAEKGLNRVTGGDF